MITVIAEKPSVAREIAKILNVTEQHDGYLSNQNYYVTWAFGHLIQLALPDDYGFEKYKRDSLPFIPEVFQLVRRQIKTKGGYKIDEGVAKQLEIIRYLFNSSDKLIVATDAGREGELIFRYIYNFLNCHKPFDRLWVNSLTDRALLDGLNNLKPGTDYDNLYLAAKARSEADWLIGINASQALSVAAGRGAYSLGRVQTPTLNMICQRYLNNKNFKPEPFWQVKIFAEKYGVEFTAISERYLDKDAAEANLKAVNNSQLLVTGVEKKEVRKTPPLLFDLTSLQKEANIRYDFSAEKTLQIAQSLYESKLISYPRTGSRYIPMDVFMELPELVKNLEQYRVFSQYAKSLQDAKLNKRSVDDSKVTDHHALIVTETHTPSVMSEDESRIYNLIAGRMLESISPDCIMDTVCTTLSCDGIVFRLNGNVIKDPGWKAVFNIPEEKDEDESENSILPEMKEGEQIALKKAEIVQKQTKPKPLYTEATLLGAMENAGKDLSEDEREAIKNVGLGTPATRAGIIQVLFHREYIKKVSKSLLPTEKGLTVAGIVGDMKIADVQMTAQWENSLSLIEQGEYSATDFSLGIIDLTRKITGELLSAELKIAENKPSCVCPKCKKANLLFYNKVVKCADEHCGLVIFRNKGGKQLTDKHIIELATNGKTSLIRGFKNKDNKEFDAYLVFDENFRSKYEFPPKKKKK